jgi:geranylgeranyl diphosphate synthase type I
LVTSATVDDLTARVEAELKDVLGSHQMDLYRMMSYHLGWEDETGNPQRTATMERTHGVACLAACVAAGGDPETALPAAASVELINCSFQIHDDVQGGLPQRHDRNAVWWVWGPAQAINAGDGMHALARLAIFRLKGRGVSSETTFRAVQLVDQTSLDLCEGRFQDIEAQERIDLHVDAYLDMAASRTGALYSCAMRLGALVSAADEAVVDALGVCGGKLGMATQIHGDLRELWPNGQGNGAPSLEVLNKKKLLPVVYALEVADVSVKRRLGDVYFKRVLDPDDVATVRQVLEELGAREYCEELVAGYRAQAESALAIPQMSLDGAAAVNGLLTRLLAD